jgi:hypothetical protein
MMDSGRGVIPNESASRARCETAMTEGNKLGSRVYGRLRSGQIVGCGDVFERRGGEGRIRMS